MCGCATGGGTNMQPGIGRFLPACTATGQLQICRPTAKVSLTDSQLSLNRQNSTHHCSTLMFNTDFADPSTLHADQGGGYIQVTE